MRKANRYKQKSQKMEFSKKWLIMCIIVSIFYTTLSYILAWFDKNTLENLSTEILEILWGTSGISFVGYALQNCCRAYTASKFGIPKDDMEENKGDEKNKQQRCIYLL